MALAKTKRISGGDNIWREEEEATFSREFLHPLSVHYSVVVREDGDNWVVFFVICSQPVLLALADGQTRTHTSAHGDAVAESACSWPFLINKLLMWQNPKSPACLGEICRHTSASLALTCANLLDRGAAIRKQPLAGAPNSGGMAHNRSSAANF